MVLIRLRLQNSSSSDKCHGISSLEPVVGHQPHPLVHAYLVVLLTQTAPRRACVCATQKRFVRAKYTSTLRFGIGYHRSFPIEWRFWAGSIMGCLCTIICNIFRDSLGELIMTRAPRYQGCSKTMSDVSSLQHLVQVVSVTVLRLVRCLWLDEWKSVLHQL